MQQTLEQRSSLDVKEYNMEKDESEGRRMMARMTNENTQSLQSRLLKRARGFIQTVDDEGEDNNMESTRSLKKDDDKPGDAIKEDKPDNKPDDAKKDDKPHDKPDDAKKDDKPDNQPDDVKKDDKPDYKPDDVKKDDKPDDKPDDAKKEADDKPAHPAPEKSPSKEEDSIRDGEVEPNEPPETTVPISPAEDTPAEVVEEANPEVEVEEISISSHKNSTPPGSHPSSNQKSGKASKGKVSTCANRLDIAYKQMRLFPKIFGVISSPADVTAKCAFNSTEKLNLGCPFTYFPQKFGFAESEAQYQVIYNDPPASGTAFWNFALYCQCYQAYDLNCAAKIPHGPPVSTVSYPDITKPVNSYSEFIPYSSPEKRLEYCQMVGVWNGDFDRSLASTFSNEIRQCGCYFVGTAKDMVGTCPGVDLGAFFKNQGNTIAIGTAQQESIQYTDAEGTYYPTMSPSMWGTFMELRVCDMLFLKKHENVFIICIWVDELWGRVYCVQSWTWFIQIIPSSFWHVMLPVMICIPMIQNATIQSC